MSTNDENIKYGVQTTDSHSDHHEMHKSSVTGVCKTITPDNFSTVQLENENDAYIKFKSLSSILNGLSSKSEYLYSEHFNDDFTSNKPNDQIVESENLVVSTNLDNDVGNEINNSVSVDLAPSLNTMKSVDLDIKSDYLYASHFEDITNDEYEDEYARAIAQYPLENNGDVKIVHHEKNDLLGSGAFGLVFKYEYKPNVKMAVKCLKNERLAEFKKLPFNTEYKNIKSINHKNLLRIYEYNVKTNKIFIEYSDDFIALSKFIIQKSKTERMKIAVAILKGILYGLHMLHSHGIMHRDIKAENVLIDLKDLTPKICDFDFAVKLTNDKPYASGTFGTATHMAPEVFDDETKYSFPADIYSYGCLVIEFLTGQKPWSHLKNANQICYEVCLAKNQPRLDSELDSITADFIKKCLTFNPNKRYTTYQLLHHPFLNKC